MSHPRQLLTPERRAQLRELRGRHANVRECGLAMGVRPPVIARWLDEMGLPKFSPRWAPGHKYSPEVVARAVAARKATMAKRPRFQLKLEDFREPLIALRDKGFSARATADKIGVSRKVVNRWIDEAGLPRVRRGRPKAQDQAVYR